MKPGTVVTYKSRNPNSTKTYIGVVVCADKDIDGNVLIAKGALTLEDAKDPDYSVVSIAASELTQVSMYK